MDLGRRARANSRLKTRQPLRQLLVEGAAGIEDYLAEIADELRVKEVRLERIETSGLRVKPNFRVLAPRLGSAMPLVKKALDAGEFRELDGGRFEVLGHLLEPDEVIVERLEKAGWAVTSDGGVTVALDTTARRRAAPPGPGLRAHPPGQHDAEGSRARPVGPDRAVAARPSDADLLGYRDWIAAEVLATSVDLGPADQVSFERA